jgi:hypothetical protein
MPIKIEYPSETQELVELSNLFFSTHSISFNTN